MSEKLTFTELSDSDLEECYRLCMRSFNGDTPWSEVTKAWEICRDDPHYRFIVGKYDGKAAAFAALNIVHTLFDGSHPLCILWFVCVDENIRRQGIGRQLFAEIERIAAEKDCEYLYLTCVRENVQAQEFYRSLGFTEPGEIAMEKKIN